MFMTRLSDSCIKDIVSQAACVRRTRRLELYNDHFIHRLCHRRSKLTFRESEELLPIYSFKHHGCASWNVTLHLTRCLVTREFERFIRRCMGNKISLILKYPRFKAI